jgi:hypothetical protein
MREYRLAEWIYEAGIGENRAALIDGGVIVEAQIELPGLRAGTVAEGRLTTIDANKRGGIVTLADKTEVLLASIGTATKGAMIRVEITREPLPEPGKPKRAKGRVTNLPVGQGPDLATRIGPHRVLGTYDIDTLENTGWSEVLESAASGIMPFPGGELRIMLTPAMTLIDVDGTRRPATLAREGAAAAAAAIRRLGIAGNIGIDLPTVEGKAERAAIADAFDAVLPQPYERTTVNGFGFLQVVRPRVRASLCELVQYEPAAAEARALMRRVQRSGDIGAVEIDCTDDVWAVIEANADWLDTLSRQRGGAVTITT